MTVPILASFLFAALCSGAAYLLVDKKLGGRVKTLERDLLFYSETMCQMAQILKTDCQRLSGNISGLEERVLELSVPAGNPRLPLERRHQVLTLARNGAAIDEIVRRLNLPHGEAELILNLRQYSEVAPSRSAGSNGELRSHAQG